LKAKPVEDIPVNVNFVFCLPRGHGTIAEMNFDYGPDATEV
jgi:hypothetical protein